MAIINFSANIYRSFPFFFPAWFCQPCPRLRLGHPEPLQDDRRRQEVRLFAQKLQEARGQKIAKKAERLKYCTTVMRKSIRRQIKIKKNGFGSIGKKYFFNRDRFSPYSLCFYRERSPDQKPQIRAHLISSTGDRRQPTKKNTKSATSKQPF